jgi:hypothetical protein
MHEPVDKGQGLFVAAKNRGPFLEAQVTCYDNRYLFIEITDQLKQELRNPWAKQSNAESLSVKNRSS